MKEFAVGSKTASSQTNNVMSANKSRAANCICYNGLFFPLPDEAKYVMQEENGVWYWTPRKPRFVFDEYDKTKEIGWMHKKNPVLVSGPYNHLVPLITELSAPHWKETLQRVVRTDLMPAKRFLSSSN